MKRCINFGIMEKKYILWIIGILVWSFPGFAQGFDYQIDLQPVTVNNLPGLQSYAYGQHNGKWLIIGGRRDGLHARQPFNAFPQSFNNTEIFVVDINSNQLWSASLTSLPTGVQEQLQSTNINFCQVEDTLYLIGGYAYSATAGDHITFSELTTVRVSGLINAIINNSSITPYFKQISDPVFALTGAYLAPLDHTFYLVGGHKFDGNYNPMGNPTYTQTYADQIRKFTINNSGSQLSFSNYTTVTDAVHLHRRDFNLLPQIFPNGQEGFLLSSGVFQVTSDLPFLYPIEIDANGYTPVTSFNQYLSHYHSACAALYDSTANEMHNLFFGGMSQYYYQNGNLIQDNAVPFVKTISRVTRNANGVLQEFQQPEEMPGLKGASAAFIPNLDLPHYESKIIKLHQILSDTILIGHIYGGILSNTINPFSVNQTNTTSAESSVYAVRLIRSTGNAVREIDGENPFRISIHPNPVREKIHIEVQAPYQGNVDYILCNTAGEILFRGKWFDILEGVFRKDMEIPGQGTAQTLIAHFIFDHKFVSGGKIIVE